MADLTFEKRSHPHLKIDAFLEKGDYSSRSGGSPKSSLREDYKAHASHLYAQLSSALESATLATKASGTIVGLKPGVMVEMKSAQLAAKSRSKAQKVSPSIEIPSKGIVVLRATRNDDRTESALVFVPNDAQPFLEKKVSEYWNCDADRERFEKIEDITESTPRSLFTGNADLTQPDSVWWEIWIQHPDLVEHVVAAARAASIDVHSERFLFPDTTVLLLYASGSTILKLASQALGAISEIRPVTGSIETFLTNTPGKVSQENWVEDLVQRVTHAEQTAPVICTLDTGVSSAHPLLAPGLFGAWSYDEAWGTDDHHPHGGHGTPLLGLVLYGELESLFNDARQVTLGHGAESMKLLPPGRFPATQPPSYGLVTQGAVSLVEIARPARTRAFCLASSTTDFPPDRPSTWSSALDQIASGSMPGEVEEDSERQRRLVMVAIGNVSGGNIQDVVPLQALEDPSQSWNALSIGGFTRKVQCPSSPPGCRPTVPANCRSPFSRGSQSLPDDLTPIKPEVMFEAGNMITDSSNFCSWDPNVSLISTGSEPMSEPLVPFWATSAAVGMAGNFMGQLMAANQGLWPETYRALAVDSARWPEPIRKAFIGKGAHWKSDTKSRLQQTLREFGYGVPDLERAMLSAKNDTTLIAQAELQPFKIGDDGRSGVFNEMHVYDLPWPRESLQKLENEIVTMKVTLSYFIEPNLTGKAATRPETYRSFGLRFEMKKRSETDAQFRSRISASQNDTDSQSVQEKSCWLLGPKAVKAGSLHCDLWRGHAVDLAGHDAIAVFPVGGWWKSHRRQKRINDTARYSLVISISAPGHNIDLYSEISAQVETKTLEVESALVSS